MTVSVQYRLEPIRHQSRLGRKWPTGELFLAKVLSVKELEDASSERGELGDEGSF